MSTTLAECPDCGTHYVWIPSAAVFRCGGCKAPDFHELAPADLAAAKRAFRDIAERWHAVLSESDAGYVLAITKREPEEEKSSGDRVDSWNDDLDDDFDPPGPYDNYTERDLEEMADDAAARYEDWIMRDPD
jgi:endogenous inhibitor of DNA gyrase (YacG/DUF329 family)